MAYERRLEAEVIGPGTPGKLRLTLGRGGNQFVSEAPADLLQPSLRMPNSQFVAVLQVAASLRSLQLPQMHSR